MEHTKLSRTDASAAVTGLGWRYVLGEFRTQVLTGSLPLAADVAGRAAAVPGAEGHLRLDIRADRVIFSRPGSPSRTPSPARRIRRGCPSHVAPAAWLGHPRRMFLAAGGP